MTDFCVDFMSQIIRIGTRGSELALWQAYDLQRKLHSIGQDSELVIIKTKGDQIQHLSFDKIEGKGFFTKEIEDALLAKDIHVAVHSLKDLPTSMQEGLVIAGLSSRADPRDMLIMHPDAHDTAGTVRLKKGSKVGTSSVRRKSQLKALDSSVDLVDIRGNVPTRIRKIIEGDVDAVILACAGVDRLDIDLSKFKVIRFQPEEFVPAPAQGVIGYQCRRDDKASRLIINEIHDRSVSACTNVERGVLHLMDGGCHLPLGVHCSMDTARYYHVRAALGLDDGSVKYIAHSQSTTAGMSDAVYKYLISHQS